MIGVGVDPGTDGAVAVVRQMGPSLYQIEALWGWSRIGRGSVWTASAWDADDDVRGAERSLGSAVLRAIEGAVSTHREGITCSAVEGMRYTSTNARRRRTPASIAALSESAGLAVGILVASGLPAPRRPLAVEWRDRVLRLSPQTAGKAADAHAVRCVRGDRRMMSLPPTWTLHRFEDAERRVSAHHASAVCMAIDALGS